MPDRKTSDAQLRAVRKYKENNWNKNITLSFTESDRDMYKFLQDIGRGKSTYIKSLIREDMERRNSAK